MKVCSNSNFTLSSMPLSIGSLCPYSTMPPRSSSQFGPHFGVIFSPVISEWAVATGKCFCPAGAFSRFW